MTLFVKCTCMMCSGCTEQLHVAIQNSLSVLSSLTYSTVYGKLLCTTSYLLLKQYDCTLYLLLFLERELGDERIVGKAQLAIRARTWRSTEVALRCGRDTI